MSERLTICDMNGKEERSMNRNLRSDGKFSGKIDLRQLTPASEMPSISPEMVVGGPFPKYQISCSSSRSVRNLWTLSKIESEHQQQHSGFQNCPLSNPPSG
jgi:hypothetical protein